MEGETVVEGGSKPFTSLPLKIFFVDQTPAGRPKRAVAMTPSERRRERAKARRKSAALESDDEGGCGQWAGLQNPKSFVGFLHNCT